MQNYLVQKVKIPALAALVFLSHLYLSFSIVRGEFLVLLFLYALLFLAFLGLGKYLQVEKGNIVPKIFVAGLLFRMAWIAGLPQLSDDFHRFIWDGNLIHQGLNPFAFTPTEIFNKSLIPLTENVENLYYQLNSPQYFSIYPPINQLFYWLSTLPGIKNIGLSILILRLLFLGIEILGFIFLIKIFRQLKLNPNGSYWYWANPLVIMEGIGNLHFEVIMIAFLAGALFYLQRKKLFHSGFFWALAIGTKLIPFMWLPFLKTSESNKTVLKIIPWILFVLSIIFIPIYFYGYYQNFLSSLNLYFHSFEFNASLYYIERAIGWEVTGYNAIGFIGSLNIVLMLSAFLILFVINKKRGLGAFLYLLFISYSIYLGFSTTLHPWYIIPLIFLGSILGFNFPIFWSFLVILSYEAYGHEPVKESSWILLLEYLPVYFYAIFEFWRKKISNDQRTIQA
jgi:alpha-1,6-mannosyltransferase